MNGDTQGGQSRVTVPAATLTAAQRVVLALLSGYKVLLSQLFAGSCRYVPSCSQYAREAVVEHGVIRGSWLAARRLARCHPGAAYGLDPVPPRAPSLER